MRVSSQRLLARGMGVLEVRTLGRSLFASTAICIVAVMAQEELSFTVAPESEGARLDLAIVAGTKGISRSRAQSWIRSGRIAVDGVLVERPGTRVRVGQGVELVAAAVVEAVDQVAGPAPEILYEDEEVLVVFKPAGLLTHANRAGGGSLASALEASHGPLPEGSDPERWGIVHRLDRDTSGVLVVARTAGALATLQAAFHDREVEKTYEGIVVGEPRFDSDWIETRLGRNPRHPDRQSVVSGGGGREALTYWEVIERFDGFAHLRLQPKTGRTHQLRVHLASVGLPIIGDPIYRARGGRPACLPTGAPEFQRHALHAAELRFQHPSTGEALRVAAPLPEDMADALRWLQSEAPRR